MPAIFSVLAEPQTKRTKTEKKNPQNHNTQRGIAKSSPHKPDPKELNKRKTKNPKEHVWSLFTNSKRRVTYRSREKALAENGSHSQTGNKEITFIKMPFSHLWLWTGCFAYICSIPQKLLTIFLVTGRDGKSRQRELSQNRLGLFWISSTELKFKMSKLSTPIIRNKLPLGLYLLLHSQELKRDKKKNFKNEK